MLDDAMTSESTRLNLLKDRQSSYQSTLRKFAVKTPCVVVLLIVTIGVLLIATNIRSRFSPLLGHHTSKPISCGNSPEEAQANGCFFDYVIMGWVPPACYDQQLSDEFINAEVWEAWDPETGLQVANSELYRGQRSLMVTHEFHWMHCLFVIRKLHRSALANRPLDGYIASYNHTLHCEALLESGQGHDYVMAYLKYPGCAEGDSYGWWS